MLSGLKVVDASTVLAGPAVGTFLAELGAEVIKIEHPVNKDVTRSWKLPSEDKQSATSAYFSSVNFRKSYRYLDLNHTEDRKCLQDLLVDADIFISNFKKGDAEKFGLDDAHLHTLNPKLVIGKITGFGLDSDRVAYDLVLQAETGFMAMNGTPESGPVKMPVALIDVLAAHHLKEGILLALLQRERNGKGSSLSVSLYEAAISSLVNQASNFLMAGVIPNRIGSKHPNIAPYGELFYTKDKVLITFAIGSDRHFQLLCDVLGLESLPYQTEFENNTARVEHRALLESVLSKAVVTHDSEQLLSSLHVLHVPVARIKNLQEVFEDPAAYAMIREEHIEGRLTKRVSSIAFKWQS